MWIKGVRDARQSPAGSDSLALPLGTYSALTSSLYSVMPIAQPDQSRASRRRTPLLWAGATQWVEGTVSGMEAVPSEQQDLCRQVISQLADCKVLEDEAKRKDKSLD